MSKTRKIIVTILLIILLCGFNFCYAVDLNLTDDTSNGNEASNTNTENTNSNTDTNSSANTNSNGTTTNNAGAPISTPNGGSNSATVTSSLPESSLGLSTILNILLIVIGILLILLAIAILIRLKK